MMAAIGGLVSNQAAEGLRKTRLTLNNESRMSLSNMTSGFRVWWLASVAECCEEDLALVADRKPGRPPASKKATKKGTKKGAK
jgi:hypothetical protein